MKLEESPHEALMREIKEELAADIRIVRLLPHVQSPIYRSSNNLVHTVILAFESVLRKGTRLPAPAEESVGAVRWVENKDLNKLELLSGTKEFVECLYKADRASYGSANIYVRMEKRSGPGQLTDYWELRSVYDLWSKFNIIERHGNILNKSTHHKISRNVEGESIFSEFTKRIRSLVRSGYYLADSDDIRFSPAAKPV